MCLYFATVQSFCRSMLSKTVFGAYAIKMTHLFKSTFPQTHSEKVCIWEGKYATRYRWKIVGKLILSDLQSSWMSWIGCWNNIIMKSSVGSAESVDCRFFTPVNIQEVPALSLSLTLSLSLSLSVCVCGCCICREHRYISGEEERGRESQLVTPPWYTSREQAQHSREWLLFIIRLDKRQESKIGMVYGPYHLIYLNIYIRPSIQFCWIFFCTMSYS